MVRGLMTAIAVAVIALAGGILATQYWPSATPKRGYDIVLPGTSSQPPTASPSPTDGPGAETVSLTWNDVEVAAAVDGVFTPPECSHEFTADASPGHSIEPIARATHHQDAPLETIEVITVFESLSGDPVHFLADEQLVIVTRDGVVVTPDWGMVFTPALYTARAGFTPFEGAPFSFGASGLCDVASEDDEYWDSFDWDTATSEEIAEADRRAREFQDRHATFPPGEYAVYVWTPVVLGEHAAVARALHDLGVTDLPHLEYVIGYSDLVEDPRVMEHCVPDFDFLANVVGYSCDVPPDVMREVLTLDVPLDYVVDAPVTYAISAPTIITVD